MWHLDQDAGTVTGVGLGAGGATVLHVAQRTESERHDLTADAAADVRDERHATGVVFETRVVETLGRGAALMKFGHRVLLPRSRGRTTAGSAEWRTGRRWPER